MSPRQLQRSKRSVSSSVIGAACAARLSMACAGWRAMTVPRRPPCGRPHALKIANLAHLRGAVLPHVQGADRPICPTLGGQIGPQVCPPKGGRYLKEALTTEGVTEMI